MLTLAGFWAGRYGETTGRGRRLSPLVSVAVITVLAALFAFFLHSLLGDEVVARHALVTVLLPTLLVNVLLAYPVHVARPRDRPGARAARAGGAEGRGPCLRARTRSAARSPSGSSRPTRASRSPTG